VLSFGKGNKSSMCSLMEKLKEIKNIENQGS